MQMNIKLTHSAHSNQSEKTWLRLSPFLRRNRCRVRAHIPPFSVANQITISLFFLKLALASQMCWHKSIASLVIESTIESFWWHTENLFALHPHLRHQIDMFAFAGYRVFERKLIIWLFACHCPNSTQPSFTHILSCYANKTKVCDKANIRRLRVYLVTECADEPSRVERDFEINQQPSHATATMAPCRASAAFAFTTLNKLLLCIIMILISISCRTYTHSTNPKLLINYIECRAIGARRRQTALGGVQSSWTIRRLTAPNSYYRDVKLANLLEDVRELLELTSERASLRS